MATHMLRDATIFLAQYDITTDHNQVRVTTGVEKLDRTVFGNTTRVNRGGLLTGEMNGTGYLSYGTGEIEAILSANLALSTVPVTVTPDGVANSRATFMQALVADVKPLGGTVGDLHAFEWNARTGQQPLVRGTLMAAKAARGSSSNSGTAQQLGAVSAAQRIYAVLHVFAASGSTPTLDVTVKSDNGVGFGTPATQITFTQATAVTSQMSSTAGAITDDWWRVDWTVGGSTPSFTFAVAIGIL